MIDRQQYVTNLKLWWQGWWRFRELEPFRSPFGVWSPFWWLLYLLDVGSHTVCGGAVVTWSRWAYDEKTHVIPGTLNRLLNRISNAHGQSSMGPLWGSKSAWR